MTNSNGKEMWKFMRRKREILSPSPPLLSITVVGWLNRFIDYLRGSSVPADAGTLGRSDVTGAGIGFVTVNELRDARK